ncbi:hypothetical protein CSUB01_08855 [Colletotrichum sublineola]|uniref:Uncharacterized protein n=1 Tax=Colletotrichum sublineola TaxID=1173701 RepID=A0A066XBL0_COLSU|nr:hypothetical protein CSUB01_08855 [Colletotrichum sublineola]
MAIRRAQAVDPSIRPGARRQHVPGHLFPYTSTGHDSSLAWRQATCGSGLETRRQEQALHNHSPHEGAAREYSCLPAVNRGRPLETMFVDPSKSFTRIGLRLLRRRALGLLPDLEHGHQLLELGLGHDAPARLLVAPRERAAQPLRQRRVPRAGGDVLQHGNDVHRRAFSRPGAPGHAAREVDQVGQVPLVRDQDDLELGRGEVAGPARRDDGVDLGPGADAEDGDAAVGGELGGRVRAALHLGVDLGPGREEGRVGQELRWGCGRAEGFPGRGYVVRRRPPRGVDQRDGVIEGLFGIRLEGRLHVREGGLPLQGVAEVAVRPHHAEPVAGPSDSVVEVSADEVRQQRAGRHGGRVARCDVQRALGVVALESVVVVDDDAPVRPVDERRGRPGALVQDEDVGWLAGGHLRAAGFIVDVSPFRREVSGDERRVQAEQDKGAFEDRAGGESVGVLVWHDEGRFAGGHAGKN